MCNEPMISAQTLSGAQCCDDMGHCIAEKVLLCSAAVHKAAEKR